MRNNKTPEFSGLGTSFVRYSLLWKVDSVTGHNIYHCSCIVTNKMNHLISGLQISLLVVEIGTSRSPSTNSVFAPHYAANNLLIGFLTWYINEKYFSLLLKHFVSSSKTTLWTQPELRLDSSIQLWVHNHVLKNTCTSLKFTGENKIGSIRKFQTYLLQWQR